MGVLLIIVLLIALIFVGPAVMLWAVNVLLAAIGIATIGLCFKTWFACLCIMALLRGVSSSSSS